MPRRMSFLVAMLCALLLASGTVMAQAGGGGGGGGGGGRGGRGGRGNFDPAQFQQMQLDNIKQALGTTDAEWQVLQPKVQALLTAQQDMNAGGRAGRGGGRGGRGGGNANGGPGGGGGRGGNNATTALARALQDLRDTLANASATADQISAKLSAVRSAREKAQADYASAQKALKDLLTPKQEAIMVSLQYLE